MRRSGDVVLRPARPWSRAVVALLRHLEEVGYAGAPRVVGDGFAADGREALAWVPGTTDHAGVWSPEGGAALGALLRGLHDATATFVPPPDAVWRPFAGRSLPGSAPVVGHGDTAPWNVVARGGVPVAFVDWETAGPFDALWELAHTAWLNAYLHDDDVAERDGLPDVATRGAVLRAIADGYGLPRADRATLVERMVEYAVHSAREDAVEGLAAGAVWRVRSAAWMLRHRAALLRAVGA
ncbi:MAG TPA: phosphotransferase [Mycobacteriales bacterium]|nr:phosphotransferase [Mycobacteriales bacterium]